MPALQRRSLLLAALVVAAPAWGQPGTLDPSFGTGGVVTLQIGSGAWASYVGLQSDGRVIVAGTSLTPGGPSRGFVARFTAGGTLDATYGEAGVTTTAHVRHLVVPPDGRALVTTASGLIRLTAGGQVDPTFGTDGVFPGSYDAFARRPDGRILIPECGSNNAPGAVLRLTPDGRLDHASGPGATGARVFRRCQMDAAVDAEGRFVSVASYEGPDHGIDETTVTRVLPSGSLDTAFGATGSRRIEVGPAGHDLRALTVFPDGGLALAGLLYPTYAGGPPMAAAVRLTPDGGLDGSFAAGGLLRVSASSSVTRAVAAAADGALLVIESFPGLVRVQADGALDPAFGAGGFAEDPGGGGGRALALGPDGGVLLAGSRAAGSSYEVLLARYRGGSPVSTATAPGDGGLAVTTRPNPAAGRAEVSVALPAAAHARAEVFDALGRRVAGVWDGPLAAGTTPLALDVGAWPPGVYVVRVVAAGRVTSAPLTVAR